MNLQNIGPQTAQARELIIDLIRQKAQPYMIERVSETMTDEGYVEQTTTEHERSMHLYDAGENRSHADFGERESGDLWGLADGGVDLKAGDRLTYSLEDYEIDTVSPVSEAAPSYQRLTLVRRQTDN